MNEAEQQAIAQMVQGSAGQMQGQPSPQGQPPTQQGQPPQQEEAPPNEVFMVLTEMLRNWKPQTEEGRGYYEEVQMLVDRLGRG